MKKIMSLLLALTVVIGLAMPVSALGKISKINEKDFQTILAANIAAGKVTLDKTAITDATKLTKLSVNAGSELRIALTPDMFLDASGALTGTNTELLTATMLKSGKITLRTVSDNEPSLVTNSIALTSDKTGAFIKVVFKDPFVSLYRQSFNLTLYLNVNGARKTATKIALKGSLSNKAVTLSSADDYCDLSEGVVATARTNVKNCEFYLGQYVSVTRGLTRDSRVYGVASCDFSEADEALAMKYPAIDYVYTLRTIGLKTTANCVFFDLDEKYYVYNVSGTYLGTSDKKLPYSTKYYLTTKKYASITIG